MRQDLFDGGVYVPTPKEVWENPYIYRYNHKLCKEKGLIKGEKNRINNIPQSTTVLLFIAVHLYSQTEQTEF